MLANSLNYKGVSGAYYDHLLCGKQRYSLWGFLHFCVKGKAKVTMFHVVHGSIAFHIY